jgi:glycosyltransferase involved in cell wall biosynthesis
MHRVRQSISYFKEFGWNPIVITVRTKFVEGKTDNLLLDTIPSDIEIVYIDAFSATWTRKIGLGNLGLRSLWFYKKVVNSILKNRQIDLIYFSTTLFPVTILGNYWKKKYNVAYVIDMQDPWYSDHYLKVSKEERPPKFWIAYHLNKTLEPIAMQRVNGIIAVSQGYCDMLQQRYMNIQPAYCRVIPFSAFSQDFVVLNKHRVINKFFSTGQPYLNVAYVGRGGHDMAFSASAIFLALHKGLLQNPSLFSNLRLYFIGTSYAPDGQGKSTLAPIAEKYGVSAFVKEYTDRIPYFEALQVLKDADMLIVPGSIDPNYTASKLYPYIIANKPVLAVFNESSSVVQILTETKAGEAVTFTSKESVEQIADRVFNKWQPMIKALPYRPATNWDAFEPYTAREMTRQQVTFFNQILHDA